MSRDGVSWFSRIAGRSANKNTVGLTITEVYEFGAPSYQNAIDLLPGWNHGFPPEMNLNAGPAYMYEDPRIHWAVEQFGSIEGKRILELGPLEGQHTYMLERYGAGEIDAVEANRVAYLRCLVAKEVFGLQKAKFHLGDFVRGLENPTRYDLIVACGVLYHMAEPLLLLERMAARTDFIYLWTHYFDEEEMPPSDPRRFAFRAPDANKEEVTQTELFHGIEMKLHLRSYYRAWRKSQYCGGPVDRHFWLEKAQLIEALRALGFGGLAFAHEERNHLNGPAMSIFARRN